METIDTVNYKTSYLYHITQPSQYFDFPLKQCHLSSLSIFLGIVYCSFSFAYDFSFTKFLEENKTKRRAWRSSVALNSHLYVNTSPRQTPSFSTSPCQRNSKVISILDSLIQSLGNQGNLYKKWMSFCVFRLISMNTYRLIDHRLTTWLSLKQYNAKQLTQTYKTVMYYSFYSMVVRGYLVWEPLAVTGKSLQLFLPVLTQPLQSSPDPHTGIGPLSNTHLSLNKARLSIVNTIMKYSIPN